MHGNIRELSLSKGRYVDAISLLLVLIKATSNTEEAVGNTDVA
jgi:hypothetical protein